MVESSFPFLRFCSVIPLFSRIKLQVQMQKKINFGSVLLTQLLIVERGTLLFLILLLVGLSCQFLPFHRNPHWQCFYAKNLTSLCLLE